MLALGFVAAGVTPAWACACGGYLPDAQSRARAYGENALVSYAGVSELSYDSRLRGTPVETEPGVAVAEIDRLCALLERLESAPLDRPVHLRSVTDREGRSLSTASTLGREVAFVIQHTIHHLAIVAVLLDQMGVQVPADFGLAPSTPTRH